MYQPEHYLYSTQWNQKNQKYKAWVAEFPSLVGFGSSLGRALSTIKSKVKKELEKLGAEAPEPLSLKTYSGKLILRMPELLHRHLAIEAEQEGVSLNQFINMKLSAISKEDEYLK